MPSEHHREPVDAHPEPARRRHAVGERLDVVRVALLGLDVAAGALVGLHREPRRLLLGVVDLGEGVAELHPADVVLEPLDDALLVGGPRERRELDRVVVEDRRLDQARLDEVRERVVDRAAPRSCRAVVSTPRSFEPRAQLVLVARPEPVLGERVDELAAAARRLQVDLVAAEGDRRRAERLVGDARRRGVSIRSIVSR